MDNEQSGNSGAERFKRIIRSKSSLEQAREEAEAAKGLGPAEVPLPATKVTGSLMSEDEAVVALKRIKPQLTPQQEAELAEDNYRKLYKLPPAEKLAEGAKVLATPQTDAAVNKGLKSS